MFRSPQPDFNNLSNNNTAISQLHGSIVNLYPTGALTCVEDRMFAVGFLLLNQQVAPGTANLVPCPTAGCCHLANLTARYQYHSTTANLF